MTGGQVAMCCAAVAAAAGLAGWGYGSTRNHDLRSELSGMRSELQQLRMALEAQQQSMSRFASASDPDTNYVTAEIARYKATLARQRYAVNGAMRDEPDPAELDAMKRALGTIDAVEHQLTLVTSPDGLAKWFDTTNAIRQRWPSQHAWLLPDLKWR